MSLLDFETSLNFIIERVFPRMNIGKSHFITVEYLGGEVLVVPQDDLEKVVTMTRNKLKPLVRGYRDGVQSNLIGSPRRILALHDLFDGNVGTSWDNHTGQRQIKGSDTLYRALLNKSLSVLSEERSHTPGRVIVLDRATEPHLDQEVADAIAGGYDLVIRPVFQGGSDDISPLPVNEIARALTRAYCLWQENPVVRIEPFHSLKERRLQRGSTDIRGDLKSLSAAGCPFQSDCAFKSLSLDPDGTLHICQEMADSSNYPLGNAIDGVFDHRTWRLLARRSAHLSDDCARCEWRDECGGGCMNEAIEAYGDPFAKTELCSVWKAIFRDIEKDIHAGKVS